MIRRRKRGAEPGTPPRRPRLRLVRALLKLTAVWIAAVFVFSALFVGIKCYSGSAPDGPAAGSPGAPARAEAFTYLTVPEWFIVYAADDYAAFTVSRPPSAFPYFDYIQQYWGFYGAACDGTKRTYPFETSYHVMLGIIGASFTIESSLKGVYENTIGRATEWLASTDTPEDAFARETAREYGTFMHTVPWYEFPFGSKLRTLWRDVPLGGPHIVRKLERRIALSAEYAAKAAYGWVIGAMSGAAYAPEDERIQARVRSATGVQVIALPRYEAFTTRALALLASGTTFVDIAGNDEIVITVLAPNGMAAPDGARVIAARPLPIDPARQRMVLSVPVPSLGEIVAAVRRAGGLMEHLYDY